MNLLETERYINFNIIIIIIIYCIPTDTLHHSSETWPWLRPINYVLSNIPDIHGFVFKNKTRNDTSSLLFNTLKGIDAR